MQSLAVKYRPHTWQDVVEQDSTKVILQNQLDTLEIKNSYLFVGSAGTGKTTCARIFANEVNKGLGSPIELDAASNNGVDDVRSIIQQAQTRSMDSEYKIFIIDECHALSNNAWQAFLKLIEEPPAKSIFIFCTTDPQKIPKTIISRVQRYDFKRISQEGIVDRMKHILDNEGIPRLAINANTDGMDMYVKSDALEYIAKIADGGMRDALTLLDKCLAFSKDLTVDNIIKALGVVDYNTMIDLTNYIISRDGKLAVELVEQLHSSGKDLRQFISQYVKFIIDVCKYKLGCDYAILSLPGTDTMKRWLDSDSELDDYVNLLDALVELQTNIRYSNTVRYDLEAMILCM